MAIIAAWVTRKILLILTIFLHDHESGASLCHHLLPLVMLLLLLLMLPLLFTRFLYSKKQFGLPASGLWSAPSLTAFVGCLSTGRPAPSERIFPLPTPPKTSHFMLLSLLQCGVDTPLAWHFNFRTTSGGRKSIRVSENIFSQTPRAN